MKARVNSHRVLSYARPDGLLPCAACGAGTAHRKDSPAEVPSGPRRRLCAACRAKIAAARKAARR